MPMTTKERSVHSNSKLKQYIKAGKKQEMLKEIRSQLKNRPPREEEDEEYVLELNAKDMKKDKKEKKHVDESDVYSDEGSISSSPDSYSDSSESSEKYKRRNTRKKASKKKENKTIKKMKREIHKLKKASNKSKHKHVEEQVPQPKKPTPVDTVTNQLKKQMLIKF